MELWGPDFTHWQHNLVVLVNGRVPGQIGIFPNLRFEVEQNVSERESFKDTERYSEAYQFGLQATVQAQILCVLLKF